MSRLLHMIRLSNQVGNLPGYGKVWYHPKGITKILGLSSVADNDSHESKDFIVTCINDGKETCFHKAPRGLHWIETKSIKSW